MQPAAQDLAGLQQSASTAVHADSGSCRTAPATPAHSTAGRKQANSSDSVSGYHPINCDVVVGHTARRVLVVVQLYLLWL